MDIKLKGQFIELWDKYFPGVDLPIVFYYTNEAGQAESAPPAKRHQCIVGDLAQVRDGNPLRFDVNAIGCPGGKRYLGFENSLRPNFEYFLSYGIPGEMEGERYKKSPELVQELLKHQPSFEAPGKYIIFKRWDNLADRDEPAVVIFFANADVLSGLFTLINYDAPDPYGVIAPMCSGCAAIVQYPYKELQAERPRGILGMFDVSARPCVPPGVLTLAAPWPRLVGMVDNMAESFLITESWNRVKTRISRR